MGHRWFHSKPTVVGVTIAAIFAGSAVVVAFHRLRASPSATTQSKIQNASALPAGSASTPHPVAPSLQPAQQFIKAQWSEDSFTKGLRLLRQGDPRARALVLERLLQRRTVLSPAELGLLRSTMLRFVNDHSQNPLFAVAAIRGLSILSDFMKANARISSDDLSLERVSLSAAAFDATVDVNIRGAAIRALGDLGITASQRQIEVVLTDSSSVNSPELARNGCLALVKLEGQSAFARIDSVFKRTADSSIFGTAAFCLGQMQTPDAMSSLIRQEPRFPDSPSVDAALAGMAKTILDTLSDSESPYLISAIDATKHMWKPGQQQEYVPKLLALVESDDFTVRQAACSRIMDVASTLPLDQEKQQLTLLLKSLRARTGLDSYKQQIQQRLTASILQGTTASIPTPDLTSIKRK